MSTTFREILEQATPHHKAILEQIDVVPELEVEPAAGVDDPVMAVTNVLAEKAKEVFLDPAKDPAMTAKEVKELAVAAEQVAKKINPEAAAEPEEEEPEGTGLPGDFIAHRSEKEDFHALTEQLSGQMQKLARTQTAMRLLLSQNIPAQDDLIEELCTQHSPVAMQSIIDGWSDHKKGRARPLFESRNHSTEHTATKTGKELARACR